MCEKNCIFAAHYKSIIGLKLDFFLNRYKETRYGGGMETTH